MRKKKRKKKMHVLFLCSKKWWHQRASSPQISLTCQNDSKATFQTIFYNQAFSSEVFEELSTWKLFPVLIETFSISTFQLITTFGKRHHLEIRQFFFSESRKERNYNVRRYVWSSQRKVLSDLRTRQLLPKIKRHIFSLLDVCSCFFETHKKKHVFKYVNLCGRF